MIKKFFSKDKIKNSSIDKQVKSMQCTVTVDIDTLTALVGTTVTLAAIVDPPGEYDVNFIVDGNTINSIPIPTDLSGIATLQLDTTDQLPGLYDLTAEVIGPPPISCISSLLTVALTSTECTGIMIDTPGPITAYIGDIIPVSITATVAEPSVVEFRETTYNMRIGSCTVIPVEGSCTSNIDTSQAIPGEYNVIATIGSGDAQQCVSSPIQAILQERPGKIIVVSIPPGGRIYLDENDTGINSSAIIADIIPNTPHNVRITLSNYLDYESGSIIVSPDGTEFIFVVMTPIIPPTGVGNLNVTSIPDGVEFWLYTEESGITPITLYDIPAGINAYEAYIEGYNGAMGSVTIKSGMTTDLNIPLQPYTENMGVVIIESIPIGADIIIDDLSINTKTSFMTLMSPGPHTYELRLPGYQSKSGSFTVVTGYDTPAIISETLQPISGTGMATILLGSAAIGMMLVTRK